MDAKYKNFKFHVSFQTAYQTVVYRDKQVPIVTYIQQFLLMMCVEKTENVELNDIN
jgi:hypothetical protein